MRSLARPAKNFGPRSKASKAFDESRADARELKSLAKER